MTKDPEFELPPGMPKWPIAFEEFVEATHNVLTPVLAHLGYTEGEAANERSFFWRDYTSQQLVLHVTCDPREHYSDIRISKVGTPWIAARNPGILGMNIVKLGATMGRAVEPYGHPQFAPLHEQYSALTRFINEQLKDILTGSTETTID